MNNIKLAHFRDAMYEFSNDYILIGGNACALLFESKGADFRETEDLDIVLVIEKWSPEFASALNTYLEEGGYRGRRFSRGKEDEGTVHRFTLTEGHKNLATHPKQIELFSRAPEDMELFENQYLIPVKPIPGVSNFSAILFDDVYYAHLQNNVVVVEGVKIPNFKCLTVLKASAWLGNKQLMVDGELSVDNIGDVHKHAFDICRLLALYDDNDFENAESLPERVYNDIVHVIALYQNTGEVDELNAFMAQIEMESLPVAFEDAHEQLAMAFSKQ